MIAANADAMSLFFPVLWGVLCIAAMAALSQHGSEQ
jgi:hypothetical protein